MKFDYHHYVPCLRWKLGEYQALLHLKKTTKESLTPLIEVSEIGWDFEKKKLAKTIDDHLEPFAKRVNAKWQNLWSFVDLKLLDPNARMIDGSHPVEYLFSNLRKEKCNVVPVTGIDRDKYYQDAIQQVVSTDKYGACLRVTLEQMAKPDIKKMIDKLLSAINTQPEQIDLVLDLEAPNFIPLEGFCKMIQVVVPRLPYLDRWRNFILLGTSFPESMAVVKGPTEIVPRHEWLLYKELMRKFQVEDVRFPTFGDYGISHPKVLLLDMRIIKPAASIRYAIDDAWYIIKGSNVRDNGFKQYRKHCQKLVATPFYLGPAFSDGDHYIAKCADGSGKTGNLATWRRVGTNHHLEKVVQDISNLFD